MSDLGSDGAFAGATGKLHEHYGIEVPVSAVRVITEKHGAAILAQEKAKSDWPDRPGVAVLITEMEHAAGGGSGRAGAGRSARGSEKDPKSELERSPPGSGA